MDMMDMVCTSCIDVRSLLKRKNKSKTIHNCVFDIGIQYMYLCSLMCVSYCILSFFNVFHIRLLSIFKNGNYMQELLDIPRRMPNRHLKSSNTICFAKSSTSTGDVAMPQWRCMLMWTNAILRWCARPAKQVNHSDAFYIILNNDPKHAYYHTTVPRVVIERLIEDPLVELF